MNFAKEKIKEKQGITLVALVITIVVLLILAGITLTYVLGDNSIFKQTSDAKIKTEIAKIEERAQVIYSDKFLESASNTLSMKIETSDIMEQLISERYTIEKRLVEEGDITGISLDKENITMEKNKTTEIKVTYEGVDDPFVYYVEVQGKYYQMHSNKGFITIDREPSNLKKADFENEGNGEENITTLTVTSSDESIATASLKAGSNNVIEITSKDKETQTNMTITVTYGSYTKICKVKVVGAIATKLEINSIRARIAKNYTRWLMATAIPSNASQEFEWSSSNINIATVDNKGVIEAKKAGTATITVRTTDGSNLSDSCEVTIVENAPDVATLTNFQTENTVARDVNGNLITVPRDFKVLGSIEKRVTGGIVIQDNEGNEFVWIPVDSVSTGTTKPADDIRLGRYEDFRTKNASGNYIPKQDADNYIEVITINSYYQELISNSEGTAAKDLQDFINKTKVNGGYYIARYESSVISGGKIKSRYNEVIWSSALPSEASRAAKDMYDVNDNYESDLINSYSWDTAIVFIQKYSGNENYGSKNFTAFQTGGYNAGRSGDQACHIYDIGGNYWEYTTEHSTMEASYGTFRGKPVGYITGVPIARSTRDNVRRAGYTCRVLIYVK